MSEGVDNWGQWFEGLRLRELKAFEKAKLPDKDDPRWRWADAAALEIPQMTPAPIPAIETLVLAKQHAAELFENPLAQIVFVDGHLAAFSALPEKWVKKGVHFLPLSQAKQEIPALVAPMLFQSIHSLGGDPFVRWHRAGNAEGVFLHVPKGVALDGLLSVVHFTHAQNATLCPHALCLLEENTQASLVQSLHSLSPSPAFVCEETEIFLGKNAALNHSGIQNLDTLVRCQRAQAAVLGEGARLRDFSTQLGAKLDRRECNVQLAGARADARLFSVGVPCKGQCFDQRTYQGHLAPDTSSDLFYKNGVLAQGRSVFSGMIDVKPKAQGTAAYQSNRNLLMSDSAQAVSMPGLEIGANDVKCSHGATDAPIDPEQLFYLRQRGIGEQQARALLLEGFLTEVIERTEMGELKAPLQKLLAQKLEGCLDGR